MDERIEEDRAGRLEGDTVLAEIGFRLPAVPGKPEVIPFMGNLLTADPTTAYIR